MPAVALPVEPLIDSSAVELVAVEVTLVILQKLYPSVVVNHEVLVIQQGLGRILGRDPLEFLQSFSQIFLEGMTQLNKFFHFLDLFTGIAFLIEHDEFGILLETFLIVGPADEESKHALALLTVFLEVAVVAGQLELLKALPIFLSLSVLSTILIHVFSFLDA